MGKSYFIWKEKDCRNLGVTLQGPVPLIRPEERVKHVEIPGRPGDLTQLEGDEIYNSYIQTCTIQVYGGYRVREVYEWLRGEGYVSFHSDPDKYQRARVIGAITLSKFSRNLDIWVGEVQFYCQPFKQRWADYEETITASGTSVINAGDVPSRPKMKVTCTGDGQGGTADAVITIGGKTLTVVDNLANTILMIDCDTMTVTNEAGDTDWTSYAVGDFPRLAPGGNEITGSGWSSVKIWKRERWL